ncbi:MAG: PIG-L family deacetylase [Acidobacteria bacterium]|nr:PIG-L family deacetylase [Acidobacteriota bacterium]
MKVLILLLCAVLAQAKTVLVVTADAPDFVLAAGGTIASMAASGDRVVLVRVTNDDKDSWNLSAEETASRVKEEVERAAKVLGIAQVHSLGYRAGELGGVSPTEIRDRLLFYVRLVKPDVMLIPNPYAEYVEVLDRHYTGMAAEEARRIAALENHQPPFAQAGLATHVVKELYYYAQPFDPRRREAESTATFAPQPKVVDIASSLEKKLRASQALTTVNYSMAMRIRKRLDESGRRLPLLDVVNEESVRKLVEINVRKLAEIAAKDSGYKLAEEFLYAGPDYQVPAKLR